MTCLYTAWHDTFERLPSAQAAPPEQQSLQAGMVQGRAQEQRAPLTSRVQQMKAGWAGTGVRSNANTTASGYQWARIKSLPEMRKVSTPPKRSPKEQKLTLR